MNNVCNAVFLDRDGVLNKLKYDYVKSIDELDIFSFIPKPIKKIHSLGFLVIVVTNQSAINRGFTSHQKISGIHEKIQSFLKSFGTKVDAFYYCPHMPNESCMCRKPKPGLLFKASDDWNIDLKSSWFIGDSESDIIAGNSAGCKTIKISQNFNLENAVQKLENFLI